MDKPIYEAFQRGTMILNADNKKLQLLVVTITQAS